MTATRGLEGIVAAESKISSIIDDTLTYVGYDIDDLTENATFEEVVYLLWHTRLPKADELAELTKALAENAEVPQAIFDQFKSYPLQTVHPMAALRSAVSLLGVYDEEADDMSQKRTTVKQFAYKLKLQL